MSPGRRYRSFRPRFQEVANEHSSKYFLSVNPQPRYSAVALACLQDFFHLAVAWLDRSTICRPAPTPPAYKETGDWKAAEPGDQKLPEKWWETFQDSQLNELEEQIDVSNQNLKAAFAQYQQSRAVLRYYRADYYPTVTATPSAGRTRYSNNRPPHNSSFSGVTFNDFVLPLELGYEVDVWGRVRRTVESSREQSQASAADLAAVNLSMHANLAFDYFAARSLDAEEKLLQDTVVQYQNALQLNEALYQGGLASEVTVQEAKNAIRNDPCSSDRRRSGAGAV